MGYIIKIEDGQGHEKYFYSDRAKTHQHGSALAGALVDHLTATFPDYAPFSTRGNPRPGDPPTSSTTISSADEVTEWP